MGGFWRRKVFLAEKVPHLVKKFVNLPNIVTLLSNMGKYAKIQR